MHRRLQVRDDADDGTLILYSLPQMTKSTIHRILKFNLKWKPFKYTQVQKLEPEHYEMRAEFCRWILAQPEDFPDNVLWSDEKWWVLQQRPHRQNDRTWAAVNPHEYWESNVQGDVKEIRDVSRLKITNNSGVNL